MNRKDFPLLLMLASGIVTCIYTFILQYSTLRKLVFLFIVMLVFYLIGSIVMWMLGYFEAQEAQKENQLNEEGEAIEKDAEGQENAESQEGTESKEDAQEETQSEQSGTN